MQVVAPGDWGDCVVGVLVALGTTFSGKIARSWVVESGNAPPPVGFGLK